MSIKRALPALILGALAAIGIVSLAVVPALAHAGGPRALPVSHAPAMLADEWSGFGSASLLVVPAAAFASDGSDPDGFYFDFAGGYVNGVGTACLKAPVYLPNGVIVNSVYASLYDNAAGSVQVRLRRINTVTGASDVMASLGTAADSTAIQHPSDVTINYPGISYRQFAYYVTTCLNYADHRVYSVRIYYGHRLYLPTLLRDI